MALAHPLCVSHRLPLRASFLALFVILMFTGAASSASLEPLDPLPGANCAKGDTAYPVPVAFAPIVSEGRLVMLNGYAAACILLVPPATPTGGRPCSSPEFDSADLAREVPATRAYIEWGETANYGHRGTEQRGMFDANRNCPTISLGLALKGTKGHSYKRGDQTYVAEDALTAGVTYHFRVVAMSDLYPERGWHYGPDHTFALPNADPTDPSCSNPLVSSVTPAQGYAGDRIVVSGSGFGKSGHLLIAGVEVPVESWSPTSIISYLPPTGGGSVLVQCGPASSDRTSGQTPVDVGVTPTPNLPPLANGYALGQKRVRGGQVFRLDGSSSSDPDGKVVSWQWSLGGKVVSKRPVFSRAFSGYAKRYAFTLTVRDDKGATGTKVVRLRTAKKGKKVSDPEPIKVVVPSDVLFAFDSCVVSAKGRAYLVRLRPLVRRATSLTLGGNTDWVGSDAYNMRLGLCRAKAVGKVLLAGVSRRPKTKVASYGERRPVASNQTVAGRAQNRRVEIVLRVRP